MKSAVILTVSQALNKSVVYLQKLEPGCWLDYLTLLLGNKSWS